jgi:hypothetical protein
MARTNLGSPDEALAGMAKVGKPRVPMGDSALKDAKFPSATDTGRTMKMPRKNTQAGDPTLESKPSRSNVSVERMGPAFGVRVNIAAPVSAEASSTQANGRIIRSAVYRSNENFNDGNAASY